MPASVADELMAGGVVPIMGLDEALAAAEAAFHVKKPVSEPICLPNTAEPDTLLTEAEAKAELAAHGLPIPRNIVATVSNVTQACSCLRPPFAVKGVGLAHKSEHGAVRLDVQTSDLADAAQAMGTEQVLVEEMADNAVTELLIGVTRDPAHGFVLTIGAGGVLTEVLRDTVSLLVPSSPSHVKQALNRLNCAPLLQGYRGKSAADLDAAVAAVDAVQAYVLANAETLTEVEINPLICTANGAVAVDALIRKASL
jgi:succinyl-CoA synthetase beta subunit